MRIDTIRLNNEQQLLGYEKLQKSKIARKNNQKLENRKGRNIRTETFSGFLYLAALVVVFGTALVCSAQDERQMVGVGITVFADPNFRGRTQTFQRDVPNLEQFGFNNRISSLRIGPGEQWEVCDQANYRGRCVVVSGKESNLKRNDWNDKISSFRRVSGGTVPSPTGDVYIVLFDQPNYRSNPTNYKGAVSSLNRRAQSVTIGKGVWELCDGRNFTGRCVTLDTSTRDLGRYNLRNRVASARPVGSGDTIPPTSTAGWYVDLFEQPNYRGNPANYKTAASNLSKNVRSVTIGKGVWELCDGRSFTGRCVILDRSVPNLTTYNIGRRIASLRPVMRQPR